MNHRRPLSIEFLCFGSQHVRLLCSSQCKLKFLWASFVTQTSKSQLEFENVKNDKLFHKKKIKKINRSKEISTNKTYLANDVACCVETPRELRRSDAEPSLAALLFEPTLQLHCACRAGWRLVRRTRRHGARQRRSRRAAAHRRRARRERSTRALANSYRAENIHTNTHTKSKVYRKRTAKCKCQ